MEHFPYRRADMVISLLPHAADYIMSHGIPADKIAYIPNGVADFTPGIRSASGDAATLVQWIHDQRGAGLLGGGDLGSHGRVNGVDLLAQGRARAA